MSTATAAAPLTTTGTKYIDEAKCEHYAHFTYDLDRIHFDALYWSLFFFVIGNLFVASWIYQRTMQYGEDPECDKIEFKRKLRMAAGYSAGLFLVAGVAVVIEVFTLLALQFCDGEDLMSLYWSTWTMLQLGAEIAILGVVLALFHALCDIQHPKWALALGTPVLVVAGFGHVFAILARTFARKLKTQHNERRLSRGISRNDSRESRNEKTTLSSATSVREAGQRSRASSTAPLSTKTLIGSNIAFEIDVGGNDDVICKWPSFIRLENGKALLQATIRTNDFDVEAQQPGPSGRPR